MCMQTFEILCSDHDTTASLLYQQPHHMVTYKILGEITNREL